MIAPVKRALRRLTARSDGPLFRPNPSRHAFLASFPRSGNTWMRAVLFHYVFERAPESFSELQLGIPDEHIPTRAKDVHVGRAEWPDARIIKTHHPHRLPRNYRNVAYLVRDPRDSLPSYWKYMRRESQKFDLSFEDFLAASLDGAIWPCSWSEHVTSWTAFGTTRTPNLQVIRYEDLKVGDAAACAKLARGLALSDPERLCRLVRHYDLERMRALETASADVNIGRRTKPGFVGAGVAAADMRGLTEKAVGTRSEWLRLMERFGYKT